MPPWRKVKLGDVIKINEKSIGKDFHFLNIEYIDTSSVTENRYEKPELLALINSPSRAKRIVRTGDTLISTVRPNLKHFGFVKIAKSNSIASTGFAVLTPYNIEPYYLFCFIVQDSVTNWLSSIADSSTTTFPAFNPKILEDLELYLPDLPTQSRIASILSAFDDKIELNRQMDNTLEQMAKALFKKYFVTGIDPDNLPEGWRWGKLINEFEIIMGQSPPGSSFNEEKTGIPFFQGRTDFEFRFPSIRIYTTDPKRLAKKFDTLLSVRAPVGDINLANENCCIGRGLAALRSQNGYQSYCFYKLRSLSETFNMYNGEGTVFGSINKDALGSLATIIPNKETVEQFEKLVQALDEHIFSLSNEISTLVSIRNSLLPKLMNGEIPVDSVSLLENPETIVA